MRKDVDTHAFNAIESKGQIIMLYKIKIFTSEETYRVHEMRFGWLSVCVLVWGER